MSNEKTLLDHAAKSSNNFHKFLHVKPTLNQLNVSDLFKYTTKHFNRKMCQFYNAHLMC